MGSGCVIVQESLYKNVLARVFDAAGPVEPEVACLCAGGLGKVRHQVHELFSVFGLGFEFHNNEVHVHQPTYPVDYPRAIRPFQLRTSRSARGSEATTKS